MKTRQLEGNGTTGQVLLVLADLWSALALHAPSQPEILDPPLGLILLFIRTKSK